MDIEAQREYRNNWHRAKRKERKALGLCSCCGKPPIPGKSYCEQRRRWNAVNPKGLSPEEKQRAYRMLDEFDGRCQCCGTINSGKRAFHLDHKDGKVRGIICNKCNVALGYLRDDPQIALQAAAYLQEKGALPSQPISMQQTLEGHPEHPVQCLPILGPQPAIPMKAPLIPTTQTKQLGVSAD